MNQLKTNRMASAAIIVMSSMLLSRLTGFLRETMLSWKVGLSWVQDAYVAAFTVPDLMYFLLVGGTISAALVPFLSGHLEQDHEKEGWHSGSSFITVVFIGTILLCTLGIIFAPAIIPFVAPGFSDRDEQTMGLAVSLTRILFPSVSFIMLAGICNGVLNSYRKFAAAAFGPSIYNIGSTFSILLFADKNPDSMKHVAAGVAASAAVYFLIQLSFSIRDLKLFRLVIDFSDKGFRMLFRQAVPSLLSSSITQLNVIISTAFVSLSTVEGSLAAFRNANTAWQLPYGIFAMGIGTAMLPALSAKYAAEEFDSYSRILTKSLTSVLFAAIPSAVGFLVLREPVVRAVFKWGGKFTENNVPQVAVILAFFSIAMVTQSIVAIMNRAFYAKQDTVTPLLVGIGSILMNLLLGTVFHTFTKLGPSGMALSFSIISTINSVLLIVLLKRKTSALDIRHLISFLTRACASAAAMGILLYLSMLPVKVVSKTGQLLTLAVQVAAGGSFYFGIMLLLKSEEADYFLRLLTDRIIGKRARKTAL